MQTFPQIQREEVGSRCKNYSHSTKKCTPWKNHYSTVWRPPKTIPNTRKFIVKWCVFFCLLCIVWNFCATMQLATLAVVDFEGFWDFRVLVFTRVFVVSHNFSASTLHCISLDIKIFNWNFNTSANKFVVEQISVPEASSSSRMNLPFPGAALTERKSITALGTGVWII